MYNERRKSETGREADSMQRYRDVSFYRCKKRRNGEESVIKNDAQLAATLDYIAKWADALEGMRRHEADCHGGVFPTLAAGPLQEIRANLEAARAFTQGERAAPAPAMNSDTRSGNGADSGVQVGDISDNGR